MSTVMVVGAAGPIGVRLVRRLSAHPEVDQVIGVDDRGAPADAPPTTVSGPVTFVTVDRRNPDFSAALERFAPDIVIQATGLDAAPEAGDRGQPRPDLPVIGTMQLLAACQRSPAVRTLVVRSSTAVYGTGPDSPALHAEGAAGASATSARTLYGHERRASELETYVRGFARRRPDTAVTILRFAPVVGPGVRTALTEYLLQPVVPVVLGRDPRFSLVHEFDCADALGLAATAHRPGVFNVAGDGFLVLSQALRRAGRVPLPVPAVGNELVDGVLRRLGLATMGTAPTRFLSYGQGVDTTRMRAELGFEPAFTTVGAWDAFVTARADPADDGGTQSLPLRVSRLVSGLGERAARGLGGRDG